MRSPSWAAAPGMARPSRWTTIGTWTSSTRSDARRYVSDLRDPGPDHPEHERARLAFAQLASEDARLVTHAYVVVEVVALVQRRLGLHVVRRLVDDLLPLMGVVQVSERMHAEAMAALLAADRRGISLVDRVSFLVMRHLGIRRAFTFDADFVDEGFAQDLLAEDGPVGSPCGQFMGCRGPPPDGSRPSGRTRARCSRPWRRR